LLVLYLILTAFFTSLIFVVFLSLYRFFKLVVPCYRDPRAAAMTQ